MSEIEPVVNAAQQGITAAAAIGAGAWVTKKTLGPTFDAVGEYLAGLAKPRLENLGAIFRKADALISESDAYPNVRFTTKVLLDASLYDDDLMQTYVAGMIAGSRNADGSDDRPIFYLSLMDGMTAGQVALFHMLYSALANAGVADDADPALTRVSVLVRDIEHAAEGLLGSDDVDGNAVLELDHLGLIADIEIANQPDDLWRVSFRGTRVGALLFDWAHGIRDSGARQFFGQRRPSIGLPIFDVPRVDLVRGG